MKTKQLIEDLKAISKDFFNKKDFISAGKINLAIDVLEEMIATLKK